MNLEGKRVLVVGGGLSGRAAASKLLKMKAEVFLTDMQPKAKLTGIEELGLNDSQLILEKEPDLAQVKPELLVLSPGVPPTISFIVEARRRGIPLWGEVELALRDSHALVIGVTGSNGKTTTTTLIGELAKGTGRDTIVAGNIGVALSGQVDYLNNRGIVVAELSSFQLELIDRLRVNIAVMLNITPDHLDRHGTMENYIAAKARILENQTKEDLAVLNWDDDLVKGFVPATKARIIFFSLSSELPTGICLENDTIVLKTLEQTTKIIHRDNLLLKGNHNLQNAMAAIAVALELGMKVNELGTILRDFAPVKHRQEIVGKFQDILFINDSKGTNPDSSIKALQSYQEPIVLIAGGKNKGLDMTEFMIEVREKVKSLILVGEAAQELEEKAKELDVKRIIRANTFEDSVQKAIEEAQSGDVVLLSPACTSWDMFKSYEERGELFSRLVRNHYSEP
ncbi:MAG: UDP-N-acetylmuramoylalanine--D-glutamate ligase [Gracilibacter sp. BRH_c7a]|nr:MAG: UDP-N-acetylmuramoylalanine--D-glutamate ligase [Gracilibacter sp. BRH_c7a]